MWLLIIKECTLIGRLMSHQMWWNTVQFILFYLCLHTFGTNTIKIPSIAPFIRFLSGWSPPWHSALHFWAPRKWPTSSALLLNYSTALKCSSVWQHATRVPPFVMIAASQIFYLCLRGCQSVYIVTVCMSTVPSIYCPYTCQCYYTNFNLIHKVEWWTRAE